MPESCEQQMTERPVTDDPKIFSAKNRAFSSILPPGAVPVVYASLVAGSCLEMFSRFNHGLPDEGTPERAAARAIFEI